LRGFMCFPGKVGIYMGLWDGYSSTKAVSKHIPSHPQYTT
jgi:hypothetical protein